MADVPCRQLLADRRQLHFGLRPLTADPQHLRSVHAAVARICRDATDRASTNFIRPLPGPVEVTRRGACADRAAEDVGGGELAEAATHGEGHRRVHERRTLIDPALAHQDPPLKKGGQCLRVIGAESPGSDDDVIGQLQGSVLVSGLARHQRLEQGEGDRLFAFALVFKELLGLLCPSDPNSHRAASKVGHREKDGESSRAAWLVSSHQREGPLVRRRRLIRFGTEGRRRRQELEFVGIEGSRLVCFGKGGVCVQPPALSAGHTSSVKQCLSIGHEASTIEVGFIPDRGPQENIPSTYLVMRRSGVRISSQARSSGRTTPTRRPGGPRWLAVAVGDPRPVTATWMGVGQTFGDGLDHLPRKPRRRAGSVPTWRMVISVPIGALVEALSRASNGPASDEQDSCPVEGHWRQEGPRDT